LLAWSNSQLNPTTGAEDRTAAALLRSTFALMYKHGVMFRRSASAYYRAVYILDGLITQLNPGFNYPYALRKYFRESQVLRIYVTVDEIGAKLGVMHLSRNLQTYLQDLKNRREAPEHYFHWPTYRLHCLITALSHLVFASLIVFLLALPLSYIV